MLKKCARILTHFCYFILQPNMVAMVVGTVMYDVLELVVETYAEYFVGTAVYVGSCDCWRHSVVSSCLGWHFFLVVAVGSPEVANVEFHVFRHVDCSTKSN